MTRIKNVQYLLLNTKKKISELAEECGFTSFSQFNRIFQKYCSQSPSEYRKGTKGTTLQTIV
jgi:transcriptional regulator GlxA family with amidase domain